MLSPFAPLPLRAQAIVVAVAAIGPVAMFANHGMVVILIAAALLTLVDPATRRQLASRRSAALTVAAMVGPLMAWAAASYWWTFQPEHSLEVAAYRSALFVALAVVAGAAASLTADEARRMAAWLVPAGFVLPLVLGFELATDGFVVKHLHHYRPGGNDHLATTYPAGSITAIMAWPLAVAAWARWGWRGVAAVIAASLVVILFGHSSAPKLAILASLGVAVLALAAPRRVALGFAVVLVVAMAVLPFVLPPFLVDDGSHFRDVPWNLRHRLYIWQFVTQRIADHPVLGWGMDTSRIIPGGHAKVLAIMDAEVLPLHPHDFILQVWLELGGVGATLLAVAILGTLWLAARRPDRRVAAMLVAGVATWVILHATSHGLWQSWWLSTAGLAIMVAVAGAAAAKADAPR